MTFLGRQKVGAMIYQYRREREMSQQQVVILVKHHFPGVHCSQATISAIEAGQQEMTLSQLGAIAWVLDMPVEKMIRQIYLTKPRAAAP